MDRGQRAALNHLHQGAALVLVKGSSLARRLAVDQALLATAVEAQNPIPDHLKPDATNPRCLCPGSTVVNLSQGQKPTRLLGIFAFSGKCPQILRAVVLSKPYRRSHGNLLAFSMVNHITTDLGILRVSLSQCALV